MITASVRARAAFAEGRLDAKYHSSDGVLAAERILLLGAAGVTIKPVAGKSGLGVVGATSRSKRVYAAEGEESLPYLRPYDVFDYLPKASDQLSATGSVGARGLMPARGTILQTCSGRNLGPLAYADAYLARFVVSDDMLRLNIEDEGDRFYTLAFLSTPTGQALLTRSKTGNVIDHLSADDLAGVGVPFFGSDFTGSVARLMREATLLREQARLKLDALINAVESQLPSMFREKPLKAGWSMRAAGLQTRMDAAHWDPVVTQLRAALAEKGCRRLGELADVQLPNWYKRHYVGAEHGRPIISGRQVLQARPVHLQYLAERSLNFTEYEFGVGTIAFGARGRAEDRLSQPTLITQDRASWLGSENVMRVRPKEGVNPGWIFLALSTSQVQAQVKAGTYGAVVDVVDARRLPDILIPSPDDDLAEQALQCWMDFELAKASEDEAISLIQTRIVAETL